MDPKATEGTINVGNPLYAQEAIKKVVPAIIELSMETMYKDNMSIFVEDD